MQRRDFLQLAAGFAAAAPERPMLVENPKGNFRFVRGIGPCRSSPERALSHGRFTTVS